MNRKFNPFSSYLCDFTKFLQKKKKSICNYVDQMIAIFLFTKFVTTKIINPIFNFTKVLKNK